MKYLSPKYDLIIVKTEDILLISKDEYEINENPDGTGNVIFNVSSIF